MLPYPGHPKGCPNYGIKKLCPPIIDKINDIFNLNKKHWFAVVEFNLKMHKQRMKLKHPNWSEKQLACCLYWQGTIRKKLNNLCKIFTFENLGTIFNPVPEALGINVIRTAQNLGIPIKKDITDMIYKIALIGYPK